MMSEKAKKIIVYLIVLSFVLPILGTIVFEILRVS